MDGSPPVTLPKMLRMDGLDRKLAICKWSKLNFWKLWKRFALSFESVPPLISIRCPSGVTIVPVPSAAGMMV